MGNWNEFQFDKIAKFIDYRGRTPKKTESGLRLITAKNVRWNLINITPKEYISPDDYDDWMTRGIPQVGDVLFTTEAPLGNVAQLDTAEKVAFAQRLVTFQPLANDYDSSFLKYYLLSPKFGKELWSKATGTTVKGIKTSILKKFKIPLPSLPEQRAIVAKLDALFERIDKAIALVKENIAHTEALMGSVLDEEFGRLELNFTINDCCILNPKKSEVKELDDVTEVSFLPMRDLEENKMFFEVKEQKKLGEVYKGYTYFADNDVLLAKVTPCFENKKAGIANDLSNGIGFGSSEYHILRANEDVLPKWLYYTVLSEQFRLLGKLQMTGAGGLKRVPTKFLKAWPMPKPSLRKQEEIISKIERVHQNIDVIRGKQKNKLKQLESLKQSLLDVAFKGELV